MIKNIYSRSQFYFSADSEPFDWTGPGAIDFFFPIKSLKKSISSKYITLNGPK